MKLATLMTLWDRHHIPACDEGMELARLFLISCGNAVDRVDVDELSGIRSEFNFRFSRYATHRATCKKCNEVQTGGC
jgi:hypothetical protein